MGAMPIPNMNPTGVIGSGSGNTMPGQTGTPFSAFGTGGPGSMNFGNSANPNPPQSGATNPFFPPAGPQATAPQGAAPQAAGGAGSPTSTMNPGGSPAGTGGSVATAPGVSQGALANGLNSTFGSGFGSLLLAYLQSNGGYNGALTQQAVDSQINAMGQQVQLGANALEGTLGASGVSGNSSAFTGALTNYYNQATTQENAITSQEYYNMWNQSQSNELSLIESVEQPVATNKANEMNWMDYLSFGLGLVGDVAGIGIGASEAGSMSKMAGAASSGGGWS